MKKRTSFPRFFTAAVLMASMLLGLLLASCTGSKKEAVVPPVRMTEYPSHASFGYAPASVADAVEESDAIAYIRIGDWLGYTDDMYSTLFSAEVIETAKGKLPSKFTLIQDGSSRFTLEGHPLFTAGNELLLFLNKLSDEGRERNKLPDDSYIITCAHITTFDVIAIDGEKYAFPRNYALLDTMPSSVRNFAQDETFLKKAVDELIRSDSIWENVDTMQYRYHVYKLDQLLSMVKAG